MKPDIMISQLISSPWLIDYLLFDNIINQIKSIDLTAQQVDGIRRHHPEPKEALHGHDDFGDHKFEVINGVAIIPIMGIILKEVPEWFEWMGISATSTEDVREQLMRAINDPDVEKIMLEIDSPGGTADGTQELGDAIFEARSEKRIHSVIRDLAASGALWLGSQANFISANITASIGSIGAVMQVNDLSKMFEDDGVKAIVIASGIFKGAGAPGTVITDEQLVPWQELIDGLNELFIDVVARGRGVGADVIRPLATGRTWLAEPAKANGLIDEIENFDEALARLIEL